MTPQLAPTPKTTPKPRAATPLFQAAIAAGHISFRGKDYTVSQFKKAFPDYQLGRMKDSVVFISAGGEK